MKISELRGLLGQLQIRHGDSDVIVLLDGPERQGLQPIDVYRTHANEIVIDLESVIRRPTMEHPDDRK